MKLFCGSDLSGQITDTFHQFEEGKRAHTIKFIPYQMEKHSNINSLNNKKVFNFPKNNKQININKNENNTNGNQEKNSESNQLDNNDVSELEIIEYPINEIKKNDNMINKIIVQKQNKGYNNNDKYQNNIINYFKNKPGFNHLNLLLDEDNSHIESNSEEKYNVKDDSSKSDEIICSYIEIDNSSSLQNKENNPNKILKNRSKIFPKVHMTTHTNYSFGLKYDNNSCNRKKMKKSSEIKTINYDSKINNLKKGNKTRKNMILNKLIVNKKITKPKDNKNIILEKKTNSKTNFNLNNSQNKGGKFVNNLKAFNSFRTIDLIRNSSSKNKSLIKEKSNIYPRKLHKLNTQIVQHYFKLYKTITTNKKIYSKEKFDITPIFPNMKGISNNNKFKKIKSKNKLKNNANHLFQSIEISNTKSNKKEKLHFKKVIINSKRNTIISKHDDSKGKLRKLILNKNNNNHSSKPIFEISLNNITSSKNNFNVTIKRGKNITLNKLMNKSEANKDINNHKKIKSYNKNN